MNHLVTACSFFWARYGCERTGKSGPCLALRERDESRAEKQVLSRPKWGRGGGNQKRPFSGGGCRVSARDKIIIPDHLETVFYPQGGLHVRLWMQLRNQVRCVFVAWKLLFIPGVRPHECQRTHIYAYEIFLNWGKIREPLSLPWPLLWNDCLIAFWMCTIVLWLSLVWLKPFTCPNDNWIPSSWVYMSGFSTKS